MTLAVPPACVVIAMTPPARHTKSAACAPTTIIRSLMPVPRRPHAGCSSRSTVRTSSSLNPASSSRSAMSGRPSSTGGFLRCPRSVDSTLFSTPVARMPSIIRSHGAFSVWKVTKQRSSSAPLRGERDLVLDRQIDCDGKSGMRDDDVAHAALQPRRRRRRRSRRATGARWRAASRGRRSTSRTCCSACSDLAVLVDHRRPAARAIPRARRSCCSSRPGREVRAGRRVDAARGLVQRVERRQPHRPRALAARDLHGERVQPADRRCSA